MKKSIAHIHIDIYNDFVFIFNPYPQGGNGGFLGFRIPKNPVKIPGLQWESWEYNGNPGSTMGILGVQWESWEYNGNPGSTMGILGVQWESWEYSGNPGNTVGILGVRWESWEYNRNPGNLGNPGSTKSAVSPLSIAVSGAT